VAERSRAEVELARLFESELGPRHPDVLRAKAVAAELDRKLK